MTMNLVIDKLVEVLLVPANPVLSSSRMGIKKPSGKSDVPAVVISLLFENYQSNGIGLLSRVDIPQQERNEILGDRSGGSMSWEIWGTSFEEVDIISRWLQERVKENRAALRQNGFLKLQPASLAYIEKVLHHEPLGSPFTVWKQQLSYKFEFEFEQTSELGDGIPIRQINVDLEKPLVESFSIQSSSETTSNLVDS